MASSRRVTDIISIIGYDELVRDFQNLGVNFPKAQIRKAARKGSKPSLRKAKALAPFETGNLRRGIIVKEEEKWKKQKKNKKAVFQLFFDPSMNNVFRKPIPPETIGSRGGQTRIPWAYYPRSVEYGFHVAPGRMTQGEHFIEEAVKDTTTESLEIVVESLQKSIDKILGR